MKKVNVLLVCLCYLVSPSSSFTSSKNNVKDLSRKGDVVVFNKQQESLLTFIFYHVLIEAITSGKEFQKIYHDGIQSKSQDTIKKLHEMINSAIDESRDDPSRLYVTAAKDIVSYFDAPDKSGAIKAFISHLYDDEDARVIPSGFTVEKMITSMHDMAKKIAGESGFDLFDDKVFVKATDMLLLVNSLPEEKRIAALENNALIGSMMNASEEYIRLLFLFNNVPMNVFDMIKTLKIAQPISLWDVAKFAGSGLLALFLAYQAKNFFSSFGGGDSGCIIQNANGVKKSGAIGGSRGDGGVFMSRPPELILKPKECKNYSLLATEDAAERNYNDYMARYGYNVPYRDNSKKNNRTVSNVIYLYENDIKKQYGLVVDNKPIINSFIERSIEDNIFEKDKNFVPAFDVKLGVNTAMNAMTDFFDRLKQYSSEMYADQERGLAFMYYYLHGSVEAEKSAKIDLIGKKAGSIFEILFKPYHKESPISLHKKLSDVADAAYLVLKVKDREKSFGFNLHLEDLLKSAWRSMTKERTLLYFDMIMAHGGAKFFDDSSACLKKENIFSLLIEFKRIKDLFVDFKNKTADERKRIVVQAFPKKILLWLIQASGYDKYGADIAKLTESDLVAGMYDEFINFITKKLSDESYIRNDDGDIVGTKLNNMGLVSFQNKDSIISVLLNDYVAKDAAIKNLVEEKFKV